MSGGTAEVLAKRAAHISKRLVASYVLDWIFIIAIAGVGGAFNRLKRSNKRTFVLQDPSIAYPYEKDTVSTGVLIIVSVVAPAVITFIIALLFVPGAGAPRGTPAALKWRRKLWEWNTAWMGLALSLAAAFMITEGLKDLAGKPRPHALAVCRPNLDLIAQYTVGGLDTLGDASGTLGQAIPIMVDYHICQETDPQVLRDAFASWPSGHSSFSFAGLLYLSFFLAAKFAVTLPYLSPLSWQKQQTITNTFGPGSGSRVIRTKKGANNGVNYASETSVSNNSMKERGLIHSSQHDPVPLSQASSYAPRNQAAAPPVFLLVLVFVPVGTAMFICVSRWFDYHHHGFDIISGALLGIFTSWFSFRFYHMPIRRGAGWSWGARTRDRSYWLGVGREGYVGDEGWEGKKYDHDETRDVAMGDLESQRGGTTTTTTTTTGTEAGTEDPYHSRETERRTDTSQEYIINGNGRGSGRFDTSAMVGSAK